MAFVVRFMAASHQKLTLAGDESALVWGGSAVPTPYQRVSPGPVAGTASHHGHLGSRSQNGRLASSSARKTVLINNWGERQGDTTVTLSAHHTCKDREKNRDRFLKNRSPMAT